jgi:metal-dependent amidase/aminoacylase/carboxypeptidase family protein
MLTEGSIFRAGATATGCIAQFKLDPHYADLRQNKVLADEFMKIVGKRPDMVPFTGKGHGASTDFVSRIVSLENTPLTSEFGQGNVSYAMPGLHPSFAIPTESGGGNHTPAYTKASATEEAHEATIAVIKALTEMSVKVLTDVAFYQAVSGCDSL